MACFTEALMSEELGKISKRIEIIRILVVILLVLFIALLSDETPYLSSLGKWIIIAVLASVFSYFKGVVDEWRASLKH